MYHILRIPCVCLPTQADLSSSCNRSPPYQVKQLYNSILNLFPFLLRFTSFTCPCSSFLTIPDTASRFGTTYGTAFNLKSMYLYGRDRWTMLQTETLSRGLCPAPTRQNHRRHRNTHAFGVHHFIVKRTYHHVTLPTIGIVPNNVRSIPGQTARRTSYLAVQEETTTRSRAKAFDNKLARPCLQLRKSRSLPMPRDLFAVNGSSLHASHPAMSLRSSKQTLAIRFLFFCPHLSIIPRIAVE